MSTGSGRQAWGDWGVLAHPARPQILLACAKVPTSPKAFSAVSELSLPSVSYHFRMLHEADLLAVHHHARTRGTMETFYVPTPHAAQTVAALAKMLAGLARKLADASPPALEAAS